MPNWFIWFSIAQTVITVAAVLIGWLLHRGYQAGRWVQALDPETLEKRFADASERSSKLSSFVQAQSERLHSLEGRIDLTVATRTQLVESNQRDHERFERQIDQLFGRLNRVTNADDRTS